MKPHILVLLFGIFFECINEIVSADYSWTNNDNNTYICSVMNITKIDLNNVACAQMQAGGRNYPSPLDNLGCSGDGKILCILFATVGTPSSTTGDCINDKNFAEGGSGPNWIYAGANNSTLISDAIGKNNYTWTLSHTTINGFNSGFSADIIERPEMKVLAYCSTSAIVQSGLYIKLSFLTTFIIFLILYI